MTDIDQKGLDAIVVAAAEGDVVAQTAVDEVGQWLGMVLSNLANLLNPGLVVLGGDVITKMGTALIDTVKLIVAILVLQYRARLSALSPLL